MAGAPVDLFRVSVNNVPFGCPASGRQNDLLAMVRGGDWKYVHGARRQTQELYNLARDPYGLHNLWPNSAPAPLVTTLRERLLDWLLGHT